MLIFRGLYNKCKIFKSWIKGYLVNLVNKLKEIETKRKIPTCDFGDGVKRSENSGPWIKENIF